VRSFIWAAPDHDLVVADYSGIEGAVAAWFAGEKWKVEAMHAIIADPSKPDMYRLAAAGIMNSTTDIVTKKHAWRQSVGKTSELSLQFQGGCGALASMARNHGLKLDTIFEPVWNAASDERRTTAEKRYDQCCQRGEPATKKLSRNAWLAAELVKVGWRATHPAITDSWKLLETGIREAIENPGQQIDVLKVSYIVKRGFLWCRLPSGRCLAYGGPRLKDQVWVRLRDALTGELNDASEIMARDRAEMLVQKGRAKIEGHARPAATALGVNSVTKKWERFALYGGLAFENCLGEETEVLTPSGWKVITDIQKTDKLWDGLAWVEHNGVVCRGFKATIDVAGVRMTPDHKVWTDDGWVKAEHADIHAVETASPCPELDRAALRTAGRGRVRWWRRAEKLVVGPVRLRHDEVVRRLGTSQRENEELRMLRARAAYRAREDARHVLPLGISRLAQHARPLRTAVAQSLSSIRRAWHHGLRSLAQVRDLLVGHGRVVAEGFDARTSGQQRRLLAEQLRVAGPEGTSAEHAQQRLYRDATRPNAALRSGRRERGQHDDVVLSRRCGLACEAHVRSAGSQSQNHVASVFDILNAGPLHRFTVRGTNGPVIVSNCVQAIARDILAHGIKQAEAHGYPVIGHVHDEIIAELPRGQGDVGFFEKLICDLPPEYDGLPLAASGYRGKRYRKD
jgi:hypothetical protein